MTNGPRGPSRGPRNSPVEGSKVAIRPLPKLGKVKRRPIGLDKGKFEVPKEFFDTLPDDLLRAFGEL